MILPGIVPRLRAFARDGFGWVAFLMAMVYQGARLLPATHPYCNPANKGRFGIRHVIAEAANNLVISRRNIDQIVIFVALLAGFVLLVAQFVLMVASVVIKAAFAGPPTPFSGMFNTVNPQNDIALTLLAQVFGVPKFFCSNDGSACVSIDSTLPTPFHQGLHALLEFYSLAILLVGVLILLYYVVLMVGETAQTGTPFGRRFNHIWAPMRLVVAVGLLVPINYGLNSAQYITLVSARMGSGFATNGWILFNRDLENATGLENNTLLARTTAPDVQHIVKFMMLVQTCRYAYMRATGVPAGDDGGGGGGSSIVIKPYLVKSGASEETLDGTNYKESWKKANEFYQNGDIIIRFGEKNPSLYPQDTGGVKPYCGEVTVYKVDGTQQMPREMGEHYMSQISLMWGNTAFKAFGQRAAELELERANEDAGGDRDPCVGQGEIPGACGQLPPSSFKWERVKERRVYIESIIASIYDNGRSSIDYSVPQQLLDRGWGGAGIWYNRIAQWNGAWIAAVKSVPAPSKLPWPMEQIQNARRGEVRNIDKLDRFSPQVGGEPVNFEKNYERYIAVALHKVYGYWNDDNATEQTDVRNTNNVFINIINMIFGLDGLYQIRNNHDTHPLAQLVALGKGIVDAAVRNLMIAVGSSAIAGGLEGAFEDKTAAGAFNGLTQIFVSFTTVGLTVGFILFYVLPFMPFMYFFFAVGGWVKSVFEAMVGVPLWALAHLRIDGNGLPGEAAMNGYFLLFEIFIRPILTVFGLLASLAVFTAMVRVLHEIFPLVIQNMTGFNPYDHSSSTVLHGLTWTKLGESLLGLEYKRDVIDEFFFTIIYTILVYMLATSSFKLIDQIPNNILRWIGAGVQTFNDRRDDPAGNLVQYAAVGGSTITNQVSGIMTEGAKGAGRTLGSAVGGFDGLFARVTGTPGPGKT